MLERLTILSFDEALQTLADVDFNGSFDKLLINLTSEFLEPSAKWRAISFHPRESRKVRTLSAKFHTEIGRILEYGIQKKALSKDIDREWLRYSYLGLVSQAKRREKQLRIDKTKLAGMIVESFLRGAGSAD